MVYDLPVMEEKVKPHQVTTLHMVCALAFIVTGAIIVVYNYTIPIWGAAILIAGIALTIIVMAKNRWVISKQVNPVFRSVELAMSVSISVYSIIQQWKFPAGIFGVLSAALLFALYWERPSGNQLYVHIGTDGVKLPSTERKRFKPWTEIETVILRFGILTVNCVDNSLFQMNLSGPVPDSEVFEAFCSAQVEEHRSKRRNDDW